VPVNLDVSMKLALCLSKTGTELTKSYKILGVGISMGM